MSASNTLNTFRQFCAHLYRGGAHGYYWTASEERKEGDGVEKKEPRYKRTYWFKTETLPQNVPARQQYHTYFGVHPTRCIPQSRKRKDGTVYVPKPEYVRPLVSEIAAVNCLFAEFDDKDAEQAAARDRVPVEPSVVVHSGGGQHLYWLLQEPVLLETDEVRRLAVARQREWVKLVGSDQAAKDLSRVLRVPGTRNWKRGYAPNYPTVRFLKADLSLCYTPEVFDALLPDLTRKSTHRENGYHKDLLSDYERVEEALKRLSPARWNDYQDWVNIGLAVYAWDSSFHGLALWDRHSQMYSKYNPGDCERKWRTFSPNQITIGSLFHWADTDDPNGKWEREKRAWDRPISLSPDDAQETTTETVPETPSLLHFPSGDTCTYALIVEDQETARGLADLGASSAIHVYAASSGEAWISQAADEWIQEIGHSTVCVFFHDADLAQRVALRFGRRGYTVSGNISRLTEETLADLYDAIGCATNAAENRDYWAKILAVRPALPNGEEETEEELVLPDRITERRSRERIIA